MSAEILREAVEVMRRYPNDPGVVATADWLDDVHANLSTYNATTPTSQCAFAVARAYLGRDS